jgi:hypothetical protein
MNLSPTAKKLWGGYILTGDELPPATSDDVAIADGLDPCKDDMPLVTPDDVDSTKRQDLCAINTFAVSGGSGLEARNGRP